MMRQQLLQMEQQPQMYQQEDELVLLQRRRHRSKHESSTQSSQHPSSTHSLRVEEPPAPQHDHPALIQCHFAVDRATAALPPPPCICSTKFSFSNSTRSSSSSSSSNGSATASSTSAGANLDETTASYELRDKFFSYYCGASVADCVLKIVEDKQYLKLENKMSFRAQILNGIKESVNTDMMYIYR